MSKLPLNHEKFHKCTLMGESSMGTNDINQVLMHSFKYTIQLLPCHVDPHKTGEAWLEDE